MQQTAENRNRWKDRENGTIIIGLDQWEHDKNRSKADAVNITVVTFSTRKTFNKRDSSLFGYDPERSSFRFSIWKTSLPLSPCPLPPFYPSFDPPGVSRRTRTNVTRSNVTLIRFQCKTYDPPIMVRSHLARYSAAISDPNCIRETRRSNHRY